jgi:hypothetical protein
VTARLRVLAIWVLRPDLAPASGDAAVRLFDNERLLSEVRGSAYGDA